MKDSSPAAARILALSGLVYKYLLLEGEGEKN